MLKPPVFWNFLFVKWLNLLDIAAPSTAAASTSSPNISYSSWDGETECYDEESLEGLQPHPNLKALELWWYMGVRIPKLGLFPHKSCQLRFYGNIRLQHLPPLNKLPLSQVSLSMVSMKALEYISEEEDSVSNVFGGSSSSSSKTIEFFPSLSSLYIGNCPNLKGWWKKDDDNEPDLSVTTTFVSLCLSELEIRWCPKLDFNAPVSISQRKAAIVGS
uniref:R13L1/DRL21-like LRR repeat region domain-containing protein n=1 Tax=Fagus sylvatica TaxID=28930 RepID=A0A2N9EL20_FAGSY